MDTETLMCISVENENNGAILKIMIQKRAPPCQSNATEPLVRQILFIINSEQKANMPISTQNQNTSSVCCFMIVSIQRIWYSISHKSCVRYATRNMKLRLYDSLHIWQKRHRKLRFKFKWVKDGKNGRKL